MARRAFCALLIGLAAWAGPAAAQQILIDRGARAGDLWVFPSVANEKHYYYVPSTASLARDEKGQEQFSYLRYVINRASAEPGSQGITEAEGGGILHFLVTYDTPQNVVRRAQRELQNKVDDEAVLRGPVIFKEGRYALVSSILQPGGEEETLLLASGNAPVMEGNRIALSFDLPAERATLLQESLKMATPDVSLVFEMTLEGLTEAFDADLIIRWEQVRKLESWGVGVDLPLNAIVGAATTVAGGAIGAGAGAAAGGVGAAPGAGIGAAVGALGFLAPIPGIGGEASSIFDELRESQAVELRTRGEHKNLEAILDRLTTTLLELLFEPVPAEDKPDAEPKSLGEQFGLGGESKDETGRPFSLGGITAGYKMKKIERSGESVVHFNSQTTTERITTIGFNAGDLWSRHGDDPRYFKTVNLADPAFQQREIHVGIDGSILPEFERYINSVTTTLRKQHQNGAMTVQEVVVDRKTFDQSGNDFRMIYGWNGDDDRDAWLDYEYQTRWSFKGGGVHQTDWVHSDANMIDLYAPYKRKVVRVLGDHEALQGQDVRAVIVHVEHPFFDGTKRDKLRVRPNAPIADATLELTLPLAVDEYDYKIIWIHASGERFELEGKDSTGLLFVDELPAAGASAARPGEGEAS